MTDAPERIWVWPDYNDHFNPVKQDWTHGFWDDTEDPLGTEYVRADRIKAQAAEIERLRGELARAVELLGAWIKVSEHCDIQEGVCCCGENMEGHSNEHFPIDHGDYIAGRLEVETRTTLAELKGQDDEWKCPINYTGCTKNCGSYGCGN